MLVGFIQMSPPCEEDGWRREENKQEADEPQQVRASSLSARFLPRLAQGAPMRATSKTACK